MPERTNGAVLKTVSGREVARGFESHPRRLMPSKSDPYGGSRREQHPVKIIAPKPSPTVAGALKNSQTYAAKAK